MRLGYSLGQNGNDLTDHRYVGPPVVAENIELPGVDWGYLKTKGVSAWFLRDVWPTVRGMPSANDVDIYLARVQENFGATLPAEFLEPIAMEQLAEDVAFARMEMMDAYFKFVESGGEEDPAKKKASGTGILVAGGILIGLTWLGYYALREMGFK